MTAPAGHAAVAAMLAAIYGPDRNYRWQDDALCAETDPELFFPEQGSPDPAARRTCRACPVQPECLEYALGFAGDQYLDFGIWAATSASQRKKILRERRKAEKEATERESEAA
jgi:WhiB family redox-sensing transcriptional regulator